jgi:hypothetical protein
MEGRGVVNYDLERTAYAVSAETSEFDDALIKRRIITFQEAMMRKGASQEIARQLEERKVHSEVHCDSHSEFERTSVNHHNDVLDKDTSDSENEDDFFLRYRRKRIKELTQNRFPSTCMQMISRTDWTQQVNEASHTQWVIVCLTSSDRERTGQVEDAVQRLALKFEKVKFVGIPHHQAIANWPLEHLPTLFLYRHGLLQHQLISLPSTTTPFSLELTLTQIGILETDALSSNLGIQFAAGPESSLMSGTFSPFKKDASRCEYLDDIESYDSVD